MTSAFAQAAWRPAQRVSVTTGVRLDAWRNDDASRTNAGVTTPLADREETAWSPRLALTWQASSSLALTGSAYRSFRAPTLNELYRPFRVGNVLTQANEALEAERLSGLETGARWGRGPASLRGTLFWMTVDEPIANVTLTVTPTLTTQQRRNLGRNRSRGIEVDADVRLSSGFSLSAGYLFADARVVENPADPTLVGLRTPQVPRHQASAQARYASARLTSAVVARWSAMQFEDDRNRIALAPFATLDALLSVPIGARLELLAAVENVTDTRYEIGRTPVPTIGPPRTARAAVRLELPGR
jgi:outer membrane receptor protein involved in Fe transport